jgi:hypothetical protein
MPDGVIVFFDIVKKGFVWASPQGRAGAGKQLPVTHANPRVADKSCTSNGLSDSVSVFRFVASAEVQRTSSGRALIMRAIKRLKGIRWMPWR